MSNMTQSERVILQNMHRAISESASEQHFTFEYNKENKSLYLTTKSASTCHTRHTITKSELYNWYKSELISLNSFKIGRFREYADYYNLSYIEYINIIKETITNTENTNPELFI